jgi:DNA-binding CsgD family transcriptional regulator
MAVSQEHVETLVDAVYEAAVAPDLWASVLTRTGQAIGATGGTVFWFRTAQSGLLRAEGWNMNLEALALYDRHYLRICPRERITRGLAAGEVFDDLAVRRDSSGAYREYYEFADAYGYDFARILLAEHSPELRVGFNFYGPVREDERETERALLRALFPHVRRASHMTLRISAITERAAWGDELFELGPPMLLVDGGGRVARMNARAEATLALHDGLRLSRGHLCATLLADDARLQREIAGALGPTPALERPHEGMALVSRPSGRPAWAVSALPLSPRLSGNFERARPRGLVTIAETVPRVSPARLRRGFGLSQAEAEVAAALAGGLHPDEVAEARGASLGTVRAQLKSIFAKLEVSTQAQLVGRVASLCGLPAPPPKG